MRLTTAISAAALFVASASATLWCQDLPPGKGGYGHLELHKNNVTTGEEYYIGFGSKTDADGNAYLVPGIQQRVDLQACDSAYIGKTGALTDGKELTIYGRLTSGGKCITRTSDSSLVLAKCITLDGPDVAPQFFTLKVPYYQGTEDIVGGDIIISYVSASNYYVQLQGGIVRYGPTKPASTWYFTWNYSSD